MAIDIQGGVARSDGPPRQFGNFEANLRFIDATGAITPPVAVLEIGTGTGALLNELMRRGCQMQGVELNPALIAESTRHFGPLPIRHTDGGALPFPAASFDVVVSFDVFEHIPDSDAHRVLKPGGVYLIQTPNKCLNVIFETIRWRSFTAFRKDHCSLHTLGALQRRLVAHGFEVTPYDVPVVNAFFRAKVRQHLGPIGSLALNVLNPDRWPLAWRTNLYVRATLR